MQELVKSIIADGKVDSEEVVALEAAIYADGEVSKEEADAMFEINDAVSGNDNCPEYVELFVKVISDFVLNDEETPDVVSEEEGDYLVSKIQSDGEVDEAEKALLIYIKNNSEKILSESLLNLIEEVTY